MEEVVKYGVDVVERLREFSRQDPEAEAEPVALERGAGDGHGPVRAPPARRRASSSCGASRARRPPVLARRSELVTAVVNLVFNAIEAMPGGGPSSCAPAPTAGAAGSRWPTTAPACRPRIERRIFEPFFTTKDQGTGLGLAMVYAFVNRHSGELTRRHRARAAGPASACGSRRRRVIAKSRKFRAIPCRLAHPCE